MDKNVKARLKQAARSGNCDLSLMGLAELPAAVTAIDETVRMRRARRPHLQLEGDEKWWEVAPLTRLIASGNAIQALPDLSPLF
jgi:hypothetical protein